MYRMLFVLVVLVSVVGCRSHSQRIYDSQIQELQVARQRGEISASEYLKLKLQMQNAHEQREATIVASPD